MVRGHHAAAVEEAVTRYMDWPIYHHGAEVAAYPDPIFKR